MTVLQQLVELWEGPEQDDYGRLRPTRKVFKEVMCLLIEVHLVPIPTGCVSADAEGGVRIEWVRPRMNVHLVIPSNRNYWCNGAYIFHKFDDDYTTEDATPGRLAHRLRQLKCSQT